MSDDSDLQAFLDSGGGQSAAPKTTDDLQQFLDSGGTSHAPTELNDTKPRFNPYDESQHPMEEGILHQAHALVSGMYHGIVSGYKGIATLATTRDPEAAGDAVTEEQAKAYQAPKADLSAAPAALRPVIEQMHGQPSPTALGDFASEHGASPGVSTALAAVPTALSFMAGARDGPVPAGDVTAKAQSIVNESHAAQNMGAASAAADVTKAPPEIQQAIVNAGGNINHDVLSRRLEAASLPIPLQIRKGMATADPTQFSAEANARAKFPQIAESDKNLNTGLIENLDEIRRESSPTSVGNDHVQNGQALLDKYKEYDAPIKADIAAKYKALTDANGGSLPIDTGTFLSKVDSQLKKQYLTASVPPAGAEALNGLRSGEPMDFEGFEALRTRLAEAQRNGGSEGAAAKVIRGALEDMPLSPQAANLKGLADQARSAAKARFNALDADPAYQAAVDDSAKPGEASPLADDFVRKYVINGKKANLDLMKQKFAADPEAQGTIKAAALNYLKSKAGVDPYSNEGNFSQHGYNKALAELEPRMDSLLDPETADQVRTLGKVARYIKQAPAGHSVNSSNTFTSMAGEHARDLATGIVDAHTLGFGGKIINRLTKGRADDAFIKDALDPGSGIAR